MSHDYDNTYLYLKNFVWADQRVKVYSISHKVLFRCKECFINWLTMLYEISKLNKVKLCVTEYATVLSTKGVNIPLPTL